VPLLRPLRRRLTGALLVLLCASAHGCVRALPAWLALRLGALGGSLARHLLRTDARRAAAQLRQLPEDRRPSVSAVFRHLGMCAAEACVLPRRADRLERWVRVEGEQLLAERLASDRGTVWVSGHTGNWELPAAWAASRGVPIHVIAAPIHYPVLDRWVNRLRGRHGMRVLRSDRAGLRRALEVLRAGGHVGLLIDQRLPGRTLEIPFLGAPARTTTAAARLARAAGVPAVLVTATREQTGIHRIQLGPRLRVTDPASVREATVRLSRGLEDVIRSRPEQWVWMHDRWEAKT
jgi:Kdo2-lipid IVA lauroyltransferase/acyltransferase